VKESIPNKKEEAQQFSLMIEKIANEKSLSYMDAVLYYCETSNFEVELAAKLINNAIKSKIKIEAEDLHYLPPSKTQRLPI